LRAVRGTDPAMDELAAVAPELIAVLVINLVRPWLLLPPILLHLGWCYQN